MSARLLGWAGALAIALGALLLFPRARRVAELRPALRAVLLDASASVARRTPSYPRFAREVLHAEAEAARAAGQQLALVVYGADVALAFAPGDPDELLTRLDGAGGARPELALAPPADLASELAQALALVEDELAAPDRSPGELVLIGDRSATGADPGAELARLARAGVMVRCVDAPLPELPDLALEALRLPTAPAPGAPLAAAAELALWPGAELALWPGAEPFEALREHASLTLEVELEAGDSIERFELPLEWPRSSVIGAAEPQRFTALVPLGTARAGRTLVRARARLVAPGPLRSGDPLPENDVAWATCRAGARRVALAVARERERVLVRGLVTDPARFPDLEWHVLGPHALAGFPGGADLVVTFDLGPDELPADFLAQHVRGGGGWLACGGWGMLAYGGRDDELSELLPLRPASLPARVRDVVFLVDGSGSMAGEPFERVKEALARLVVAARPGDHLQLRFFTATLLPPQRLRANTAAQRERATRELLAARVPGGNTAILYSLEALARERDPAREALVVLLSDGQDRTAFDVPARAQALRASFQESRTELAIIAVGADANLAFLGELLPPGDAPVVAADLGDLAELFQREIHRERLREGDALRVEPADPASIEEPPLARDVLRAELSRARADWPPARRFVRAEARPGAAVLWRDDQGEPVLGMVRRGAGLVAAWGSWAAPDWSPDFARADDLLGPLYRALARPDGEPSELALELSGDRLVLTGLAPDAPAVVRARILAPALASAFDGSGLETELGALELTPPPAGSDARARRAAARPRFLERAPAGAVLRVGLEDARDGREQGSLTLALPPPVELTRGARPIQLPTAPGSELALRPGDGREPDPRAPALLAAGLLALTLAALLGALRGRRVPPAGGSAQASGSGSRARTARSKGNASSSPP